MLKFVIIEWGKADSIFFKGYNVKKEFFDNDSKEIKKEKLKHNALYLLYNNIIHIAFLFVNLSFFNIKPTIIITYTIISYNLLLILILINK
jgi:hypothetical protein